MSDMFILTVASQQPVKVKAVEDVLHLNFNIKSVKAESGIDNQPVGFKMIRQGALNRLNNITTFFAISFETGVIGNESSYQDVTIGILRTPYGLFEQSIDGPKIPAEAVKAWLELSPENRRTTTFGSLIDKNNPNDWYKTVNYQSEKGHSLSRQHLLSVLTIQLFYRFQAQIRKMPVLKLDKVDYKNVQFIDIQSNLLNQPADLIKCVDELTARLVYNYVIVADARGFLFAGLFAKKGIPVIMARKENKLPKKVITEEYKKEYGNDSICIEENSLPAGSKVLIIDDLLATGGTMKAIGKLVEKCQSEVIAYICPFALERESNILLADLDLSKVRFAQTQNSDFQKYLLYPPMTEPIDLERSGVFGASQVFVVPPSLQGYIDVPRFLPIRWGHFSSSPNIELPVDCFKNKIVTVYINALNMSEAFEVLSVLRILHRKDALSIEVKIPFMEPATQDRIEYKNGYETVAMIDTFAKLLGKYKTTTYDLHAEQSQFAFHDLRNESIVKKLWDSYTKCQPKTIPCFPDEGSFKRFSKLLEIKEAVCFRKIRGPGDTRIVSTDDKVIPGQRYVIIDDLVRSGSTLQNVAKYLLEHGALEVDALFAHAPFEPSCAKYLSIFNDIWTSNSCADRVPDHWIKYRL